MFSKAIDRCLFIVYSFKFSTIIIFASKSFFFYNDPNMTAMIVLLINAQKNKARIENQRLRDSMDPFLIPTDRYFTFTFFTSFTLVYFIYLFISFMERYRMPPVLVQKLIGELSPFLPDDSDINIPLHLRVLATLNFFARGCYQRRVGMDAFGMMSQTMISKSVEEISKAITNHLGHKYIKFHEPNKKLN